MEYKSYSAWQDALEREDNKWRTITIKDVMGKIGPMPISGVQLDAVVTMTFTKGSVSDPIEVTNVEYDGFAIIIDGLQIEVENIPLGIEKLLHSFLVEEAVKYVETIPEYNWTIADNE